MILFAEISILSIFALKKFEINGFISTLTVWEFSIPFSSLSPFNDMIFVFMSIIISPIKSPTVSSRILFSIPAIAKELINILNSLKEQKEVIELELQHSDISLNAGGGISVKIPPII